MEELIDSCKKGISLPQFWECFRERTENWWETFAEMEAELRQMMDEDKDHTRGAEIVAQMEETLNWFLTRFPSRWASTARSTS